MMMNLFSSFDPSSLHFVNNWIVVLFIIAYLPVSVWSLDPKANLIFMKMNEFFLKEFKPLMKTNETLLMIPIILFTMISFYNTLGLLPYALTTTSHLTFTMAMAIPLWLLSIMCSIYYNSNKTLSHMIPTDTPIILMPFMSIIETISLMIRPITLSIRLSANMIAGHMLMTLLMDMNDYILLNTVLVMPEMLLMILEMSISIIQSYVFMILILLYFSDNN